MADISVSDIVEVMDRLREESEDPEGFFTVQEIRKAWDQSEDTVRLYLRRLMDAGQLEAVKVKRPCIDGTMRSSPAYRVRAA